MLAHTPRRARPTWPLGLALLALVAGACAPAPPAASPTAAAPPTARATAAPPATPVAAAAPPTATTAPTSAPAAAPAATVGPSPGAQAALPAAGGAATWRVVANTGGQGANLRATPAASAPLVKVLREGTLVLVLGPERREEDRAWREVQDDAGAAGWVAAELLAEPGGATPAQAAPAGPAPGASAGGVTEQPRGGAPPVPAAAAQAGPGQATARYLVPTISCPSCAARIKANAKKDPGVLDVAVDLATQRVTVVYDPSKTTPEQIAEAIRKGGDTVLPGD